MLTEQTKTHLMPRREPSQTARLKDQICTGKFFFLSLSSKVGLSEGRELVKACYAQTSPGVGSTRPGTRGWGGLSLCSVKK